ncbi:MAG TPA: DNA primase [Acidobacteriaceae bacterium]|nr:DNA primase [Acidobacteriaceae bacterium]
MSDFAQEVKQRADIVKVIGGYIRLRKAGAQNYSGLCPFHKEKSPSFSVHAGRQFFHCFGCGVSGDVFTFVGKIENLSFPEAVRAVAQKCGIPLPKKEYSSPEEAAEAGLRRKLLDLHEAAAVWFEEQLRSPEGALAREYLAGRGVTAEAVKTFRIGYAPDNFNGLRDHLARMGDEAALRASGLFSSKDGEDAGGNVVPGRMYDRFRRRIMFPICAENGKVIAFTARIVDGPTKAGDKPGPKYLNSPETPLYSKGQVLYNLDKAKAGMRQLEFALLVEGQMDCISVYMRGILNVIATSGTAFTEQQVGLLRRQTTNVVANFDPDAAGANAAEKSISLLTEEGFSIKVVTLDGGLDPDRFIRERGVEAYVAEIKKARSQADYLIDRARQQFPGVSAQAKIHQMNFLLPHIRRIPHALERDQFAHDAAQKLGIDSAHLRQELREAALTRKERVEAKSSGITEVERVLLRALASSEVWEMAAHAVETHPEWFEQLASFGAMSVLAMHPPAGGAHHDVMGLVEDAGQRAMLAQVLLEEKESPPANVVEDALHGMEVAALEAEQRRLRAEIATAEARGDVSELMALTQRKLEMDRKIRGLHG